MNIKHGGNVSKETADLIKQLEQSSGTGIEHTLQPELSLPDGWYFDFYTTTSQQNITEEFEYNQGKEFNERLYELFKSGILNAYLYKGDTGYEVVKVEFNSIDENGVITVYVEGAPETLTIEVPNDTEADMFDGGYVDTTTGSAVMIEIHKKPGEQP